MSGIVGKKILGHAISNFLTTTTVAKKSVVLSPAAVEVGKVFMSTTTTQTTYQPTLVAALKQLKINGSNALKPILGVDDNDPTSYERRIWHKPSISKRKMNVLRKNAIKTNTYGSFNHETLMGWDKEWDIDLAKDKKQGMGRVRITKPKLTKRFRTRDERMKKIDMKLIGMDESIEALHYERIKKKSVKTFESTYQEMMALVKK